MKESALIESAEISESQWIFQSKKDVIWQNIKSKVIGLVKRRFFFGFQ